MFDVYEFTNTTQFERKEAHEIFVNSHHLSKGEFISGKVQKCWQ